MIKIKAIFILILVFIFILIGSVTPIRATDFSSANFISRDPIINDFGGRATSTNFEQVNAGGQIATGESTSTSFIIRSGFLYFEEKVFTPKSQNWRWYDDETNETPASSLAAENVAPVNIADQNIIKLRFTVKDIASATSTNTKFKLQFSEYSDFSQGTNDVAEISNCLGNSLWCYAAGAGADNEVITTRVLSDSAVCAGGVGAGCGTHNTSGSSTSTFITQAGAATEYEFTVKQAGARANATYFFRAFDTARNKPVPVNVGKIYPSLSTAGANLTLSVQGLPAQTPTQGVITAVATSPTGISFGDLNFDAEVAAAQRLVVTTNATQGYQIFILERQGLLGPGEIAPIAASNENPEAWAVPVSVGGAFGYHSGDATLVGGSTRFAPYNTYAKLETTAKEVAYSSIPVVDEATDIVFKIQITNQQEAGVYDGAVSYIIVPTF